MSETSLTLPAERGALSISYEAGFRKICAGLRCGSLTLVTPHGLRVRHDAPLPGPDAVWVLHRWRTLHRLLFDGDVGFGEAFVDGDWSSPDVPALIELAARNLHTLGTAIQGNWFRRALQRVLHFRHANTKAGSRRNIVAHYDLGNEFYAKWLDEGMTYSSALYRDPAMTLEAAQTAKQDLAIAMLDVPAGSRVLEIGIGWGGMAERLRDAGHRVTGLTLSPSQLEHAAVRVPDADLVLRDYRDETGVYDGIVSIEMLEAVGEAYWPTYFAKLKQCLAPGGRAVLQAITIADDRFEGYRRMPDFIQRYIFPGGMLPSPAKMNAHIEAAGLRLTDRVAFGLDYARTLAEWRHRFEAAWPEIAAMGFPPRFRRLWTYYLAYCEGGFRAGAIDVGLWRLEHA